MDIDYLIKFGMTKTEAKIFLELLNIKETTIGPIIQKTGLHRGTVYNSINNLIKKGFVSFIDRVGSRYYTTSGEKIFSNILKEREEAIKDEKKKMESFFEKLNRLKGSGDMQEINVSYGVEAFKALFLEIYDECKKNNLEYYFQGRGGEMQDATGKEFYRYTQKLKKRMKIKCRVILDKENITHSYHKYVAGNIRYLPTKIFSPINIWIYGDTILIVLFRSNPLTSIKIKSHDLTGSFRNYFEYLWSIAKR